MARWPWVSRLAWDLVVEELRRVREQNDRLVEHITRMDRVEHGLGEHPVKVRTLEPMPKEVYEKIREYESSQVRAQVEREAQALHRQGVAWQEILERLEV
jgi:hypothetical protein